MLELSLFVADRFGTGYWLALLSLFTYLINPAAQGCRADVH
ncbi:protein of unknown function [Pseudomonas inefficax]|uniref:Uncharacterized protein n=1 Tax=Pseudomonas inefficax TaxID=2078786 RepID=A0AAQ1SRF6_9PSED|nr:protein of unknown function [Pseudomonas inefficax]